MAANLPSIKSITVEEFPEQREWIGKLVEPLNRFMSEVFTVLNKGLTISGNLNADIVQYTVTGGMWPFYINNSLRGKPVGLIIIGAYPLGAPSSSISAALFPEWIADGEKIKVKTISGLTTDVKYVVTFLVLGG